MRPLSLLLVVCLCLLSTSCGSAPMEVGGSTDFQQIRQRAVAALSRPGQVFHAVETVVRGEQSRTDEVWLDLENDVARVSEGGRLRVFHDGRIAELDGAGRLQDADIWQSDINKSSALALSHIAPLFSASIRSSSVSVSNGEGDTTYRLDTETEWPGDWTGTERFEIYLDEEYLPVRIVDGVEGAGSEDGEIDTEVKYDFIPRSDLPAGFISFDAVKALIVTPLDDMKRAAQSGLTLYWLGETFEDMKLKDFRQWTSHPTLTYGQGEPMMDPDWIMIDEYTPEGWAAQQGNERCMGYRSGPVATEMIIAGVEATLCELPWAVPAQPEPAEGAAQESTPTAPGDDCFGRHLVLHFPNAVVVVNTSSGACGTNPYRNRERLLRLGALLRPFEVPAS